ncbi:MAG: NADH-ubiquinone oxidoreductase-F iron-sulfur binding region domain-containing protein [Ignavibacteria bacterium]|nr:NADH-ubiquinone oxidoreductase-F iron-sulfur binding region domain-containing protein [Ignavibacteria bacterium]
MAYRTYLMVCAGTGCVANQSMKVKDKLEGEIRRRGLQDEVSVVTTGCNGFCAVGPLMVVQPDGIFYQLLKETDIPFLVEEHLIKGRPVKELLYTPPKEKTPIPKMSDIPFFADQTLIVLRNRGLINPEIIDEYIARGGYEAIAKVLTSMTPDDVIREIKASGLRGRGGGGFPTGIKWETCKKMPGDVHYVICNADEGDPGAFMDRSTIESDPHAVIEGMLIGAYAIGSTEGYVYIRNEYPIALERLKVAIKQAREYGLLGEKIFNKDFEFDIRVVRGAGAFVCGESTALMASIEGRPGEPRAKYVHTVERGLWDKPTCLNNVETWANVPQIILRGAQWFSSIGTGDVSADPWGGSKGTKVFSLAGKVNNTGLIEVPMGITLRKIIFGIGGGIKDGKKFKAVQTGGPSGGFIPESLLDLPVDYEELTKVGSMMGSGGMVVADEDNCMVDMAKYFLSFTQTESCGKCVPCREGTKRMLDILEKITVGEGTEEDLVLLEELSNMVVESSLCALGGSAPNPVLTTLKYFREEYEAHVKDKKCPGHTCRELIQYIIDPEVCLKKGHGCHVCAKNCPDGAVVGETKQVHAIDVMKCGKCGICYDVCKFDAIHIE